MGKLILASASPRRSEILRSAGFPFDVFVSDADESLPQGLSCAEAVRLLAERKAAAVAERFPNEFVLGADTVVELDAGSRQGAGCPTPTAPSWNFIPSLRRRSKPTSARANRWTRRGPTAFREGGRCSSGGLTATFTA